MQQKRRTLADEPFLIIRSTAGGAPAGQRITDHVHDWRQLIYVASGLMTVTTEVGSWTAPPSWAIWVPAGVRHSIRFVADSDLRSLYLRPAADHDELPEACTALAVSPLLRELIVRATEIGMLDRREPIDQALARLITAEFTRIDAPPFTLPQPTSAVTLRVAALIAVDRTISSARLARAIGMSQRALERRFRAETGMIIGRWRRHRIMLAALEQLAAGGSVKAAAATAGYTSASAFIAAFERTFGTTPGRYFGRESR